MKLTLGQAAKHAGRAKGTLSNALKNGQMSGVKDEKGRWQIDPSELNRWLSANPLRTPVGIGGTTPLENADNPMQNSALVVEVELLREMLGEARADRDSWKEQLERQSADHRQALAALADKRENAAGPRKRSLWARLVG